MCIQSVMYMQQKKGRKAYERLALAAAAARKADVPWRCRFCARQKTTAPFDALSITAVRVTTAAHPIEARSHSAHASVQTDAAARRKAIQVHMRCADTPFQRKQVFSVQRGSV